MNPSAAGESTAREQATVCAARPLVYGCAAAARPARGEADKTMEKPWLKEYPEGMPEFIDVDRYGSLVEIFDEAVNRFGEAAFINFGQRMSYADLARRSRDFGAWLQRRAALGKGERIAIMMPNLLQYPVAVLGALQAGLTIVNTNPLYTARELRHQLADSGARAIVILENFCHVLEEVIGDTEVETVIVTRMGDQLGFPKSLLMNLVVRHVKKMVPAYRLAGAVAFRDVLSDGATLQLERPELGHADIAFLQYTGGTTGLAKGAMLTHRNLVANVVQAQTWIELGSPIEAGAERVVTALPLYHIFALTANLLVFMSLGADNLMITNPRDMPGFVKELRRFRATVLTGVNTLFNGLLNTPGFAELDFSGFKLALGGGMAVQESVARRWQEVTGRGLIEAYGLTETSPAACMNPLTGHSYNGSIGLPIPSTECTVRDDQGRHLPVGEVGELCIRGPQVMAGYWKQPQATAEVLDDDGWLRTGDMARMDENGYFYVVDRLKDMILVSGFNVYPNEIEAVVAMHPGVLEAAAIGEPDERSGEVVKLFVVRKDPSLTAEALIAHCREELTGYKVPKRIEFRDELPKSNVGKILRRELRNAKAG